MASVKIFSLVVRTLAKPIATSVKAQATEHESFRRLCIGVAQKMHRLEARMRLGLLNEEAKNVRPLNDVRAVQNGATFIAESFLFMVAAGLVLGETYRSSRKETRRRDDVRERLEALEEDMRAVRGMMEQRQWEVGIDDMRERYDNIDKVLSTVVANGLRAGWLALGHNDLEAGLGLGDAGLSFASSASPAAGPVARERGRDNDSYEVGLGSDTDNEGQSGSRSGTGVRVMDLVDARRRAATSELHPASSGGEVRSARIGAVVSAGAGDAAPRGEESQRGVHGSDEL